VVTQPSTSHHINKQGFNFFNHLMLCSVVQCVCVCVRARAHATDLSGIFYGIQHLVVNGAITKMSKRLHEYHIRWERERERERERESELDGHEAVQHVRICVSGSMSTMMPAFVLRTIHLVVVLPIFIAKML